MKSKINIRLVGIAILAVIATVIGITIIYYSLFQRQVREDLRVSTNLLKNTHDLESIDASNLRITWINKDGSVLYDNNVSKDQLSNHLNRPEIQDALKTGEGEAVRNSDTMNTSTFYYAILLDDGTVLRAATDAQSIWSVFLSAAPIVFLIIFIIIAICVIISRMLTSQLLLPIENMAKNLENTDYESPYKELDPLAKMLRSQHTDVLSAAKARQDFTANVSHELKTPLTAISGYAELLEGGMVGEDQKQHCYQEIEKNSKRLLALINDIIRLSELDTKGLDINFEKLDLFEVTKECMEGLGVDAKQREIDIELLGESCIVYGNREMLRELIENLAGNAIRYNNPGGRVTINIKPLENRIALIVKDNGIGIPASDQQRVFERFYRVDKSRSKATGGTGLGLAIVKHIVEIHDAKIELDSVSGVGTTVKVVL